MSEGNTPLNPTAHDSTTSSVLCGPVRAVDVQHEECPGWLRGDRASVVECGCWCHKRLRVLHAEIHQGEVLAQEQPKRATFEEIVKGK